MTDIQPKRLSLDEQKHLDDRLIEAAMDGNTKTVKAWLAAGANVHALVDAALRLAAQRGHMETVKTLLAAGADVHAADDNALWWAIWNDHPETVKLLAKHIFAPNSWRGKSRVEIEVGANTLYNKIKINNAELEHLHEAATILADCAIDCWHQVRPAPPKIQISPLSAHPRPL